MPDDMMVIGYDANGNPILAPANNAPNPSLEAGEDPLPPLEGMMDFEAGLDTMNGQPADYGAPAAVVNDMANAPEVRRAEPAMQPTGAFMDLGFIQSINNAATDEEATAMYNALDPVQKRVYDRSYGINISPEWAAGEASKFYEEQDRLNDPKLKAEMNEKQQAELSTTQAAFDSADKILTIMDRLRGFRKDEPDADKKTPKYFGRVGPVDSRFPAMINADRNAWFIDYQALRDQLSMAARGALKGTGPISDFEQKMLGNAAMGGLDYGRDDASFQKVFEETYDMTMKKRDEHRKKLEAMSGSSDQPAASGAAPSAAPQQTKTIGNQTWVRTPDGWVPQQ